MIKIFIAKIMRGGQLADFKVVLQEGAQHMHLSIDGKDVEYQVPTRGKPFKKLCMSQARAPIVIHHKDEYKGDFWKMMYYEHNKYHKS